MNKTQENGSLVEQYGSRLVSFDFGPMVATQLPGPGSAELLVRDLIFPLCILSFDLLQSGGTEAIIHLN